ncbi:MAG: UMP kinase, partial [Spirochaetes bacterium GWB1_48_6]
MNQETTIISLGGSIIAPQGVDAPFIKAFHTLITKWLDAKHGRRVILITGGGAPARIYQEAYREAAISPISETQDWIGIAATRLNAALIKGIFQADCTDAVVTDPTADFQFTGRVLVGAGWKPGFSTDFDAVLLAERFGAKKVINLSNISQVYTADPKKDPQARPLPLMTWKEFKELVGEEWSPGLNAPFDPIATKKSAELGLEVVVASGRDLPNLEKIL